MRHFTLRLISTCSLLLLALLGLTAAGLAGCGAKAQPVADQSRKFLPADESQASATTEVAAAAQSEAQAPARRAPGQPEFAGANAAGTAAEAASNRNTSPGSAKAGTS